MLRGWMSGLVLRDELKSWNGIHPLVLPLEFTQERREIKNKN